MTIEVDNNGKFNIVNKGDYVILDTQELVELYRRLGLLIPDLIEVFRPFANTKEE